MQTPKQKAVLYLDRNQISFYSAGETNVYSCSIAPTALNDLEVKNDKEIISIISQFISQNKLPPALFITILSHNVVFEKDIVGIPESQANDAASEFINTVPFENVISKVTTIPNGYRVVVINSDYFETISQVFEQHGFQSEAALADYSLGPDIPLLNSLDLNTAKYILQKFDMLKTQSILPSHDAQKQPQDVDETSSNLPQPQQKSPLPLLLSVFGALILILLVLVITQFLKKPSKPAPALPKQVIVPTPTPVSAPSTSPSIFPTLSPTATKSALIQSPTQP
jgi:hypothetical protein